jgi:hypothetical protein
MWFTLHGVADALRGEHDPGTRLLLLSMLEQGLCDLATANAPCAPARFTSLIETLRATTLAHANVGRGFSPPPPGGRAEATPCIGDEIASLRFTGTRPSALPAGFGRRKFWITIPEALAVHHDTLESLIESTRRAAAALNTVPALVIGIRSSGSLLAPLLSALCARDGAAPPPYATLRPLLDRQLAADEGNAVAVDDHARRLIESCRGDIWVVDDPSDSGRTRDAAVAFVQRLAPGCTVTFVPVGEQSAALRDYDRRTHARGLVTRLAPRESHEEHHRTAWLAPERGRVYKAYGDPRIAALECRALRAFSPALDYQAAGEFVSSRYLGEPHRTVPTRAQIVAVGESMGRYREIFRVEPVAPEVWSDVLHRRGAPRGDANGAVEHLVRGNGQLAWWHYRWTGPVAVERVSADLGHWSTVIDAGELLASALVELELDPAAFRLLVSVYVSSSGDRNVWERMDGCLRLYLRTVSDRARRAHPPVEERHAAVRHGMAWLESASR